MNYTSQISKHQILSVSNTIYKLEIKLNWKKALINAACTVQSILNSTFILSIHTKIDGFLFTLLNKHKCIKIQHTYNFKFVYN